jgi:uncharacterized protein YfaS (alpha-2-macroglobulin family)
MFLQWAMQCFALAFFVSMAAWGSDPVRSYGEEKEFLRLFTEQDGSYYGGVITRTLADEQVVWLDASFPGEVSVDVYRAGEGDLLGALAYKKRPERNSTRSYDYAPFRVDTGHLAKIASSKVSEEEGRRTRFVLPVKEPGIYYARATKGSLTGDAFFVVSNIATQIKEGDRDVVAWTLDTKTGRHVSSGEIEVYSLEDGPHALGKGVIGSDGVARSAFDKMADVAVIRSGGETAMVPMNFTSHSDRWFVGSWSSFTPREKAFRYFAFTDRAVYQPGDKIFFKAVMREDNDARYGILQGLARVKIYKEWIRDSNKVFEKTVAVSSEGSIDGDFALPGNLEAGSYYMDIEMPGYGASAEGYAWYAASSAVEFKVDYYRKPEYGIDLTVDNDRLIVGDTVRATVSGSYFSGQPLAGETVQYAIQASTYHDSAYYDSEDSRLSDDYRYGSWWGSRVTRGTATLDAEGKATIEFQTQPAEKFVPQVYRLEVTTSDDSENPVFESKNVLVMPGEFGIYRKDHAYGAKQGEKTDIPVILKANRDGVSLQGREVRASVHLTKWIEYEVEGQRYPSYRSEERDLEDMVAVADEKGEAVLSLMPQESGSYEITVRAADDRGNTIVRETYLWVSDSSGYYYRGNDQGQSGILTLRTDKQAYRPNESVRVTVSSSVPQRDVWLVFERDGVHRYRTVSLDGTSKTVALPLEEGDMPNIFLSAVTFDATRISTDQAEITVSTESKQMRIEVHTDKEQYAPGETLTAEVSARDFRGRPMQGEVTLWAVDKALFEIVDKGIGDIFKRFWEKRYESTEDAHSLQDLTYMVDMAEQGGCFAGDTPVLMSDGSLRPIEEVKEGDEVLTRIGEDDASLVSAKVTAVHRVEEGGYLLLNGSIKVTPIHRMYVDGEWKRAGDIQPGETLTDAQGRSVTVESIEWQRDPVPVYNLTVEKYHTYFAGGVWVHNDKGPGMRSVFSDTAYWNPRIRLGADGKAKVTFKLPDNTTTWVISAVGANQATQVGQARKEIAVTKDLIVRPILPNILRIGDRSLVRAIVQNTTERDIDLTVGAEFDAGRVGGDSVRTLTLRPNGSETVAFELYPEKAVDEAKITVAAEPRDGEGVQRDVVVSTVPVYEYGFAQKRVETGTGSQSFVLEWPTDAKSESSGVTLDLSSSLLGTLPSAMRHLVDYPYGCVEQTTSRFVPLVIAKQHPELFGEALRDKDTKAMLATGIKNLRELQQERGSWGFWHDGDDNPFITAYVIEYLKAAREFGVETELIDQMLERAKAYVVGESQKVASKDFIEGSPSTGVPADQVAAPDFGSFIKHREMTVVSLAYAKTLLGIPTDRRETQPGDLINSFEMLPPDVLSLAVLANLSLGERNPDRNGASALLKASHADDAGRLSWDKGTWTGYYASADASTAMAVRALTAAGTDRKVIVQAVKSLDSRRRSDYWSNTFATAQVVRALADFNRSGFNGERPDYRYRVLADGKEIFSGSMQSVNQNKTLSLDGQDIVRNGSRVEVVQEGEGDLYVTLTQNMFRADREFPGENGGLTVERNYENLREKDAPLGVGDKVKVRVSVRGAKSSGDRLVVEDQLPAGMVPVNTAFKNERFIRPTGDYGRTFWWDSRVERYTQNGAVLTAYVKSERDIYEAEYVARVVNAGEYIAPPAYAELMYDPEVRGYSSSRTVVLESDQKPAEHLDPGYSRREDGGSGGWRFKAILAVGIVALAGGAFALYRLRKRRNP